MTVGASRYVTRARAYASVTRAVARVKAIEQQTTTFQPLSNPTVIQDLVYQNQATSFAAILNQGDSRVYANSTSSTIDEETNAAIGAYARFDDIGGNGNASTSIFDSTMLRIPLEDNEGRTAYYHGHWKHIRWNPNLHPEVTHTKQFMVGNSIELNVPGNTAIDTEGFVYYDTHANFNISASTSVSLWFYPTNISQIAAETWRTLFYRRIDASNYYAILIKPADSKIYVFINEAAAITKLVSTDTVNTNAWNNIIFTYNPTTNALVIYLNNSSASSTPADSYTPPYSTDANMYLGGLPNLPDKRFTGYLDNFVFWTAKILTGTEAGNMWSKGTIV